MSIIAMLSAAAASGPGSPAEIWQHIINDFANITSPAALSAFVQVLMIDVVLAGDNAIVVGALAAGLPIDQRTKVILIGILAALALRIVFALAVSWLLGVIVNELVTNAARHAFNGRDGEVDIFAMMWQPEGGTEVVE